MANRVYKLIELVGTSDSSIEDAIDNAVLEAKKNHQNLDWFEVIETRGCIDKQQVRYYQVHLKIGCYESV